jgi:FkbM family methyltransferase
MILDNLLKWKPEIFIAKTRTDPDFIITGPVSEKGMDLPHLIKQNGVWAPSETLIFKEILRDRCVSDNYQKNPLVIDAGANAGYFSMLSATLKCRVIAIEPIPDPIFYFNLSAHLNQHMDRITIYHGAISDRNGTIFVNKRPDQDSSIAKISEEGDGVPVQSLILSDLIKEDIILLKVDIEGFEDLAMKGLEPSFEKYNIENIIMEIKKERDLLYKIQFINKMIDRGYFAVSYKEGWDGKAFQGIECIILKKLGNDQWIPWEDVWFIKSDSKTWKRAKDKLTCHS